MRRIPVWRLLLVPLLALAAAGCTMTPPDWAAFDVDRYPVGAVPSQAGFYAGAYASAPVVLILGVGYFGVGIGDKDKLKYDWSGIKAASAGIGVITGLCVGAPFHLLAQPFRWVAGSRGDAGPGEEREEEIEQPTDWDDRPPATPRDYPWPPKLVR